MERDYTRLDDEVPGKSATCRPTFSIWTYVSHAGMTTMPTQSLHQHALLPVSIGGVGDEEPSSEEESVSSDAESIPAN